MRRQQSGFQLLELLVVLTVSAVLASLIVPALLAWSRGTMVRLVSMVLSTSCILAVNRSFISVVARVRARAGVCASEPGMGG